MTIGSPEKPSDPSEETFLFVCLFVYKETQDGIPGSSGRDEPSSNLLHITKDWILAHRSGQRHSKSSPHCGVFSQNLLHMPTEKTVFKNAREPPPSMARTEATDTWERKKSSGDLSALPSHKTAWRGPWCSLIIQAKMRMHAGWSLKDKIPL